MFDNHEQISVQNQTKTLSLQLNKFSRWRGFLNYVIEDTLSHQESHNKKFKRDYHYTKIRSCKRCIQDILLYCIDNSVQFQKEDLKVI